MPRSLSHTLLLVAALYDTSQVWLRLRGSAIPPLRVPRETYRRQKARLVMAGCYVDQGIDMLPIATRSFLYS